MFPNLNPEQQRAVDHSQGPLVVFAGAGSGKTRVITHRIAHVLEQGIPPYRILAMTFTNKAAKEMKERLKALSPQGYQVHIGTFHSSCAKWLREFGDRLGYRSDFSIYTQKEAKDTLKLCLEELKGEHTSLLQNAELKEYLTALQNIKTLGLFPQDLEQLHPTELAQLELPPLMQTLYKRYQEKLAEANAMDFSDLQLNVLLLLKTQSEVRDRLQKRYLHILIDEYQDTNSTQFQLIQKLYHPQCQLCVVGDDDQAIYSWRGANPEHILNFCQQWDNAQEIRLEQNYRCSNHIVSAASSLIQQNKIRASKSLWTENTDGDEVTQHLHTDSNYEAWEIIQQIEAEADHFSYEDVAILYRTRSQSRSFEEALRNRMIPYQIYGAAAFYDRHEIRDLLSWFRILINPNDIIAFQRVINVPSRKIGAKGLSLVMDHSQDQQCSMLESIEKLAGSNINLWSTRFQSFVDTYRNIHSHLNNSTLGQCVDTLVHELQYIPYIEQKFEDSEERIENIHELSAAISEYASEHPDHKIEHWLQQLSLNDGSEKNTEGVHLMTMHAAKGLEFPRVYIAGVEERLIPHVSSLIQDEQIEEERRLMYVGMTRAKSKLSLHRAEFRRHGRDIHQNPPSRFLSEIPNAESSTAPTHLDEISHTMIGQRVEHPSFGLGTIAQVQKQKQKTYYVVSFDFVGLRKVDPNQLQLFGKPQSL